VLAARQLEGIRFGLGSTLVFRRSDLTSIGGFEALADYLTDDYEIGRRIAELRLEVKLSEVVVETYLPAYTLRGFLEHQLRWARGVRDSRRAGYVGLLFTFGIFWALLALAAAGAAAWAWALLGIVLTFRFAMALVVGKAVLHDHEINRSWWLIPLRDLVAVVVWVASFAGNSVNWRGDRFELKDGKLVKSD
jgi:ceramide glucosyltransferase